MLSVNDLHSFYDGSHTLHGVSFDLEEGGVLAVLGRNGVGKTTLLKSIMGLAVRSTGSIELASHELINEPTYLRARAGIGYVPQGRQIIPDFTVRENIILGGFADEQNTKFMPEIAETLFPYIVENLDRRGALLSGGQQQQLAIVRALATDPRLLLLDEPTEGIQPNIVEKIEEAIITLNESLGISVILVDQNIEFARRAAKSFLLMEKGRIVAGGPIDDLTDDLVHQYMAI
ncbi:ABC transporter ATP-binding protein (plasmid) [Aestuarium zhoushanense]|nr:ABC transporter ATP-binding protein [Aestuarium zhoushanense]